MNKAVHDVVRELGGSISAEHGIGQLKRDELLATAPPVGIDLMRRIKAAFDPAGIMNPGKVICKLLDLPAVRQVSDSCQRSDSDNHFRDQQNLTDFLKRGGKRPALVLCP